MYVSTSLEELRREEALTATEPGVIAHSATPSYERALREDCIRIVEKFVKLQNPKAVSLHFGDFTDCRFICVGYGLSMVISSIPMTDMKLFVRIP